MKMKYKETEWHSFVMKINLVVIVCLVTLLAYWAYRPYNIYYDVHQPYDVINEDGIVEAGTPVFIRQEYCKNGNNIAKITIILEDGYYETIRSLETRVAPGCYDRVSQSALVPFYTQPGKYRIRYRVSVQVNPIREVEYVFLSEWFEVVPSSVIIK